MIQIEKILSRDEWDKGVQDMGGHPLQLWGWGEAKSKHNWAVDRIKVFDNDQTIGLAQLLIRQLPFPLKAITYVPRGPICKLGREAGVLEAIADYAKRTYRPVAVTIEPDWEQVPEGLKWEKSINTVLIPNTLILDLTKSEDELMADMSKKTRQYIRKSLKEPVKISRVTEIDQIKQCLSVYRDTAKRAGFAIHPEQYYLDIFNDLKDAAVVMAAYSGPTPIAFVWFALSSNTSFELYGGMNKEGQRLRINYGLKWRAIQEMKRRDVKRYDVNGLLNDGISTFKRGFANHETHLIGTYEKSLSMWYPLWSKGLPLARLVLKTINTLRR